MTRDEVVSVLGPVDDMTIAEIVRRHNPHFADMHRRLSEAGKPKKVIRIAVARKLLVQLNAKARDVRRDLAITA